MISESSVAPAADPGVRRLARVTRRAGAAPPSAGPLLPADPDLSEATRRFYENALRLFGERGYHAVSVRDLTSALGLQASSLYAHAASKQQLLAELIRIGHEAHRDSLRLALLEVGSDPCDQIAALTRAHVRVHATYPLLTRVCNRELGAVPDDRRDAILAIRLEAERLFLDVIERGIRLGAFTTADPVLGLAAIGAMGMRVAEWWSPELDMTVEHVADTYAAFAVKLLT